MGKGQLKQVKRRKAMGIGHQTDSWTKCSPWIWVCPQWTGFWERRERFSALSRLEPVVLEELDVNESESSFEFPGSKIKSDSDSLSQEASS